MIPGVVWATLFAVMVLIIVGAVIVDRTGWHWCRYCSTWHSILGRTKVLPKRARIDWPEICPECRGELWRGNT